MNPVRTLLVYSLSLLALGGIAGAAGTAKHVVIVVWDGMRPDFISAENTPNLEAFRKQGVFFSKHHPVYPSSTEVNGTAIGTGAYPGTSGIVANVEYRPLINRTRGVSTEEPDTILKGDKATNGNYLLVPTVPEILRAKGIPTVVAGTKQVVNLIDRKPRLADSTSVLLAEGKTLPPEKSAALQAQLQAFPAPTDTKAELDVWTSRALCEEFWKNGVPPYSVLWLAEPDYSQHNFGPGSPQALAALRRDDARFGLVLSILKEKGVLDSTDILIVSDHGFSTIERPVDVALDLAKAGFSAQRVFPAGLQPGGVLVVSNGGTVCLYVGGKDKKLIGEVVTFLQRTDYAGVIFTKDGLEGTFPLSLAKIDSPTAPDIVVSLRWLTGKSANGTPGLMNSEGTSRKKGQGNHTTLGPTDMRNTLVAGGPDFKKGFVNTLPSGNVDVAPTALWLLGVEIPSSMNGRVLSEAFSIPGPAVSEPTTETVKAHIPLSDGVWSQYLQISKVNGVSYFDQGNGEFEPAKRQIGLSGK